MKKALTIILSIIVVVILGYLYWPKPEFTTLYDTSNHINTDAKLTLEQDNEKNDIKIQYHFYDETETPVTVLAKDVEIDKKRDILYVFIKPVKANYYYSTERMVYVKPSPTLAEKLVNPQYDFSDVVKPYMYEHNYSESIIVLNTYLRKFELAKVKENEPIRISSLVMDILTIVFLVLATLFGMLILIIVILAFVYAVKDAVTNNEDKDEQDNKDDDDDNDIDANLLLMSTTVLSATTTIANSTH